MKKREKIIVVGAGIAGIAAARFEVDKGNEVVLLEASDRPGGLLKSDLVDGYMFDYGTHIIPETGLKELDEILFGHLTNEEYSISKLIPTGNYFNGVLNEKSCYVDTSTLAKEAYHQGCHDLVTSSGKVDGCDLQSWYDSRYGKTFSREVFCPVIKKYIGIDAGQLDASVGYFFDMSRLLAFDQKTTDRLSVVENYYAVLGHHERKEGVAKYYPKHGGVGKFVDDMISKIDPANFKLLLNTKMTKVSEAAGVVEAIHTNHGEISADRVIWTIPIAILSMYAPLGITVGKPQFRKTSLFDYVLDKPLLSDVTFINVYDLKLYSGRITLYQNLGHEPEGIGRCTVEVLSDVDVTEDVILKELVDIGVVANDANCLLKKKRDVANGFPVLDLDYVRQSKDQSACYHNYFKNIHFLGKASEKAFFMTDVLKEVYTELVVNAS